MKRTLARVAIAISLCPAFGPAADAEGICAAKSAREDIAVNLTGKVVETGETEGDAFIIIDDGCQIPIYLDFDVDAAQQARFEACEVGQQAQVIGNLEIIVVYASAVLCE